MVYDNLKHDDMKTSNHMTPAAYTRPQSRGITNVPQR